MFSRYELNLCFIILHSAESKDSVLGKINTRLFASVEPILKGKSYKRDLSNMKFIHISLQTRRLTVFNLLATYATPLKKNNSLKQLNRDKHLFSIPKTYSRTEAWIFSEPCLSWWGFVGSCWYTHKHCPFRRMFISFFSPFYTILFVDPGTKLNNLRSADLLHASKGWLWAKIRWNVLTFTWMNNI